MEVVLRSIYLNVFQEISSDHEFATELIIVFLGQGHNRLKILRGRGRLQHVLIFQGAGCCQWEVEQFCQCGAVKVLQTVPNFDLFPVLDVADWIFQEGLLNLGRC